MSTLQPRKELPKIPKGKRVLFSIPLGLFVLIGLLRILVFLPPVQSWLIFKARGVLESRLGTEVSLSKVDFALPDRAQFNDLRVMDTEQDTLVHISLFEASLFDISVWDFLFEKDEVQSWTLGSIAIEGLDLNLYRRASDSTFNFQFVLDSLTSGNRSGETLAFRLYVKEIILEQSRVRYRDFTDSSVYQIDPNRLNYRNLDLQDLSLVSSFHLDENRILSLDVKELALREAHTDVDIQHLASRVKVIPPDSLGEGAFIHLGGLRMFSGRTRLAGRIDFPGAELQTLLDANFDEPFRLELEKSSLDMGLISYFSPIPLPIRGLWDVGGICEGSLAHLELQNFSLGFGDSTYANLSGTMSDITRPREARMNLRIPFGYLEVSELERVIKDFSSTETLDQVRRLQVSGTLQGGYYDFRYEGKLETNVGSLTTNLHLTLPPVSPRIRYEGELATQGLNVDALLSGGVKVSDQLNFVGRIDGEGTDLATMNAQINAYLLDSRLQEYALDTLNANVVLAENYLKGHIYGDDGEGIVDLDLDLDLRQSPANYFAKGTVKNLNLKTYGIYSERFALTSQVEIDFEGDSLDGLVGELKLQSTLLTRMADTAQLNVPDLFLRADGAREQKYINMKSSMIDADLAGSFDLSRLIPLGQRLVKESQLYFSNDDSLIQEYYATKIPDSVETNLFFGLAARDSLNQLFDFLEQPYYISPGALVWGELSFGSFEQASIRLDSVREIDIPEGRFIHPWASIDLFKQSRDNNLLFTGQVGMDSLRLGPQFDIHDFDINLQGSQDTVESILLARQGDADNEIKLKVLTSFESDGSIVSSFDSTVSYLVFYQDSLFFNSTGKLTVSDTSYDVRNLIISDKGARYIRLDGLVSEHAPDPLRLTVNDLSLALLEDLYPLLYHPTGLFGTDLEMYNLLSEPYIQGNVRIDSFKLDEKPYGNVFASVNWGTKQQAISVNATLWEQNEQVDSILSLNGQYVFVEEADTLDFQIRTQQKFPLDYAMPFVKTQLYGLEGNVELEAFEIHGPIEDLVVNGTGHFEDARFGLEYFQTDYRFNGQINFDDNNINFPRIKLYDRYDQPAEFHGTIRHRGLREFDFSLQLDEMRNFLIMDTQEGDNDLFYGTIFVQNGIADISGDLNKLVITAFGASGRGKDRGSILRIPISDFNELERPDFVRFVGEEEALDAKSQTDLTGIELNVTAQITEDIEIEMIFDEQAGDIMRGKGSGTLSMEINEDGEFFMNGDYEITEGDYLFTAQSIVKKRFEVKPGGTLVWSGDPYSAQMDIEAIYPVRADIKDLLDLSESRYLPVNVLMGLEGELMAPEIGLAIELPNVNNTYSSDIINAIKTLEYDEQELNKQVFSLMVFRRFAPIGGFGDNLAGTGITSSISELLSNQFNYWLSQATTDRLSVNVGTNNFQDMSLLVSYKLFNDRVTLERDGTLINSASSTASSQLSVGNLRMIIKLLPSPNSTTSTQNSAELVVEVFNRTLDSGQATVSENSNQTGIGLFYKKDFDNLQELLKRREKKPNRAPDGD